MEYKCILFDNREEAQLVCLNRFTGERHCLSFPKIGSLLEFIRTNEVPLTIRDVVVMDE